MDLRIVLRNVLLLCLVALRVLLVHCLYYGLEVLLCLHVHDELRVVAHTLFLLVDRFEEVCYFLNARLVFLLNCLDHVFLQTS